MAEPHACMTEVVRIRLTPDQLARLREAAAIDGSDVSAFIRATVLKRLGRASKRRTRRGLLERHLALWTAQVCTIASHLATLINAPQTTDQPAIAALRAEVAALHRAMIAAYEAQS